MLTESELRQCVVVPGLACSVFVVLGLHKVPQSDCGAIVFDILYTACEPQVVQLAL